MWIDLTCQHLEFHLLLFIDQFFLIDLRFIHLLILLLDILHHDLQVSKRLRKLIITLHYFFKIIILITCLVHHLPQSQYTPCKIPCKEINQYRRNYNSHCNDRHADIDNIFDIIVGFIIQRTDIDSGIRLIQMQCRYVHKAGLIMELETARISEIILIIIYVHNLLLSVIFF